jgi:hypothetical protein
VVPPAPARKAPAQAAPAPKPAPPLLPQPGRKGTGSATANLMAKARKKR